MYTQKEQQGSYMVMVIIVPTNTIKLYSKASSTVKLKSASGTQSWAFPS